MKKETVSRLVDEVDATYIEEYLATEEALRQKKPRATSRWVRFLPIAAALAVVVFLGGVFLLPASRKEEPQMPVGTEETAESSVGESHGEGEADEPTSAGTMADVNPPAEDPPPETEDKPIVSPDILYDVFSLFSINDLKTYFSNGFADLSLYETPPVVSFLVSGKEYPSASFNGYFVDLYELFPALNPEKIVLKDIGFDLYPGRHSYEYDCHTLDGKGGFRVRVEYQKNAGGMADMTEEEITATYSRFIENGNEIVFEDYAKTQYKPHTWKGIMYIGIGDGYTTVYEVWNGKVEGMSIYTGDLVISVFAGIADEYDYLTHEDLRPIACLHTDSPERDEALRRIAAYCQALQKEHA